MVRAKFTVTKHEAASAAGATVILAPVTSGSKENESFFKYTPFGEIRIGTVNQAVVDEMPVGKTFYVDFTPAE